MSSSNSDFYRGALIRIKFQQHDRRANVKVVDGIVQSAVGNFHWNQVFVIQEQLICIVGLEQHLLQNIQNHFRYRYDSW